MYDVDQQIFESPGQNSHYANFQMTMSFLTTPQNNEQRFGDAVLLEFLPLEATEIKGI